MTARHARIGKVRMKNGGAEIRVLDRIAKDPGGENWCGKIVDNARAIAGHDAKGARLVGYFIMGMFSDGSHSTAWRYDPDRSPVPRRLFPGYVSEVIREDLITEQAINDRLAE